MLKSKLSLKTMGAAAALGIGSLLISAPSFAQTTNLNDVLQKVREDAQQLNAEDRARLQEFESARDNQQALFDEASQAFRASEARGRELSAQFDANEVILSELGAELETQAGDFGELLGQFRTAAGETMPIIATSLSNFDDTTLRPDGSDRVSKLSEISQARALPTRSDLDSLPKAILAEMIAQSEIKTFTAPVAGLGDDGATVSAELLRVGVFTAATTDGTKFVEVIDPAQGDNFLRAFASQPAGPLKSSMSRLISAGPDDLVKAPVDPSKGNLFGIQGELPTLGERLAQGGVVGNIIFFGLLPVGVALALFKIVTLFLMGGAMRRTAKTRQGGGGNPLARVFEAYQAHKGDDLETLELKLDEQILKESPKIERFNDIVKVLSAVAPLLGLLGTVIGMIITFTAITIYGAGDPKLMAGGISTALVTTVLGLVAAIPLLLLHAIASSMARNNQQILDEQAAGLVAESAERGGAAA